MQTVYQLECGLKVRIGVAGDPLLRHPACETVVSRPVFLITGDVYDAMEK